SDEPLTLSPGWDASPLEAHAGDAVVDEVRAARADVRAEEAGRAAEREEADHHRGVERARVAPGPHIGEFETAAPGDAAAAGQGAGRVDERLAAVDADDAAPDGRGSSDGDGALAAGQVQDA